MLQVDGKVAVVTGAAGGLGLGLARRLGARGARVVLADVDAAALDAAVAALRRDGVEATAAPTDVTDAAAVDALTAATEQCYGPASIVCSNAGVSVLGRAWELGLGDWRWVYNVNVWGAIHMIRSFVPGLVERNEGHVIVTVSNTAVTARARYGAYGSSKHAALSICESLQQDLTEIGSAVRVTAALPGPIRSRMADTERQRPAELAAGASVDPAEVETVRSYLAAHGVEPDVMAEQILTAAGDGVFYCFTHANNIGMVHERAADIEAGRLQHRVQAPI